MDHNRQALLKELLPLQKKQTKLFLLLLSTDDTDEKTDTIQKLNKINPRLMDLYLKLRDGRMEK